LGLGLSKLGFCSENRGLFADLSVVARHGKWSNSPREQMSSLAQRVYLAAWRVVPNSPQRVFLVARRVDPNSPQRMFSRLASRHCRSPQRLVVTPQFPVLKFSLNKSYKIRVLLKRSVTFHLKNHFDNNLSNYKIFN